METKPINSNWSPEHRQIVSAILGEYRENGKINLIKAFKEHPEWKTSLLTGHNINAVRAFIQYQKRKEAGTPRRKMVVRKKEMTVPTISKQPETQNNPTPTINYCPGCGCFIGHFLAAENCLKS